MNTRQILAAGTIAAAAVLGAAGTAAADEQLPSNVFTPTVAVEEDEPGWNPITMGNRAPGAAYQPLRDPVLTAEIRELGFSPNGALVSYTQPGDVEDVVAVVLPAQPGHKLGVVIYN